MERIVKFEKSNYCTLDFQCDEGCCFEQKCTKLLTCLYWYNLPLIGSIIISIPISILISFLIRKCLEKQTDTLKKARRKQKRKEKKDQEKSYLINQEPEVHDPVYKIADESSVQQLLPPIKSISPPINKEEIFLRQAEDEAKQEQPSDEIYGQTLDQFLGVVPRKDQSIPMNKSNDRLRNQSVQMFPHPNQKQNVLLSPDNSQPKIISSERSIISKGSQVSKKEEVAVVGQMKFVAIPTSQDGASILNHDKNSARTPQKAGSQNNQPQFFGRDDRPNILTQDPRYGDLQTSSILNPNRNPSSLISVPQAQNRRNFQQPKSSMPVIDTSQLVGEQNSIKYRNKTPQQSDNVNFK